MKAISDAVQGQVLETLPDKEAEELHLNAFRTASLRRKLNEGRGWEGALVGLVREILAPGETTGQPGWRKYRFQDTSTTFEFDSFGEWITDPNGLGTTPKHLIELLEISPDEEGRALADRVRQELKLKQGTNRFTLPDQEDTDNVHVYSRAITAAEAGNSAAGVRRKIRNWIKANPTDPNHDLAQQWLAKLEANPRSRLHQQALREIGIGGERKKLLDVSGVSDTLLDRLHSLARDEGIAVAELIEDALAVYFRMEEQGWPASEEVEMQLSSPGHQMAPVKPKAKANGQNTAVTGVTELPALGFYRAAEIARVMGKKPESFCSRVHKVPDGTELCQRELADAPIRIVVRKDRPAAERCEVIAR